MYCTVSICELNEALHNLMVFFMSSGSPDFLMDYLVMGLYLFISKCIIPGVVFGVNV